MAGRSIPDRAAIGPSRLISAGPQDKPSHAGWLALCNALRFGERRRQAWRALGWGAGGLVRPGQGAPDHLHALDGLHASLRLLLESMAMDGRIDVTTLLFLVVAVVIFLKLRSVLGRRTGHEQGRYERYKAQQEAAQRNGKLAGPDKVVTLPRRERDEPLEQHPVAEPQVRADVEERVKGLAAGNAGMAKGLVDIVRTDPTFDPDSFLRGARAAYELIVTAFAEGNRKTLRNLLSREVYDGFAGAIAERESRGEQVDQSFVGIKSADIVKAELKTGVAQVTVKFVSELISATRDSGAAVIRT